MMPRGLLRASFNEKASLGLLPSRIAAIDKINM